MPQLQIVSLKEAQGQGRYVPDYVTLIQQVPAGQAGKLSPVERENPATIRRRLQVAATALGTNLIIKRSGENIYFWSEARGPEQPRSKCSYTRRSKCSYTRRIRRGSSGSLLTPDMLISEPEAGEQGVPEEESPELGQTEQVVSDAMRRVDPE